MKPDIVDLDSLAALVRRECAEMRPELLRLMTDFYMSKPLHSDDQIELYTKLALPLLDKVDAPVRAEIAARLSNHCRPPAEVMRRLLRDEVDPTLADPVPALFAGVQAKPEELNELFFTATPSERRLILINLTLAPLPPAAPIESSVARSAVARLERAALEHNTAAFARELEAALGISHAQAQRLIDDNYGEPVLVAALALDMPETVLQRILLCLNPAVARSVQRIYQLSWLYEEIDREAALRLVAIWRAAGKTKPATGAKSADVHSRPIERADDVLAEKIVRAAPPPRRKIDWEAHALQRTANSA